MSLASVCAKSVGSLFSKAIADSVSTLNVVAKRNARVIYLRYPSETKKVRKHSMRYMLSKPTTKKLLMQRILKGDQVIAYSV